MRRLLYVGTAGALFLPTAAFAQTIPSAATVDLANIANVLLGLAAAAVLAAIPIVVPYGLARLKIANNADMSAKLVSAAEGAAGAAYSFALAHEGGLSNVNVHSAALATGLSYLNASVKPELDALGVTPDRAAEIVSARLGKLLAADSTVTAGAPAQVPTPVLLPAPKPTPVPPKPAAVAPPAPAN